MTSPEMTTTPELLPGLAAGPMTWWVIVVRVITLLAAAGVGIAVGLGGDGERLSSNSILLLVAVGVLILINMAITMCYLRREQLETRAGYTTFKRKHLDLPQLDPRTGDLLRVAGQPYVKGTATVV